MRDKISSFQMSSQFNGHGDTVYLKADTVKIPPVDQDDITLTPDYSQYALYAVGGVPVVLDPQNIDMFLNRMLGSRSVLNQVILTKGGPGGGYTAAFRIATRGFTDASYPVIKPREKEAVVGSVWYFVVTGSSNLIVKRARTTKKDREYIIALVAPGERIKVVTINGNTVTMPTEDETERCRWVKVLCKPDEGYKQEGDGDGEIEGWVQRIYVREDRVRVQRFNEIYDYSKMAISYIAKGDKTRTKIKVTKNIFEKWYSFKDADSIEQCPNVNGKWKVAVGPGILDWEYPINGTLGREDEFKGFSKCIKVRLHLKDSKADASKPFERILECIVTDLKAHSFHYYPYFDEADLSPDDALRFSSEFVDAAIATAIPGLVQTGIRYPYAGNGDVVSLKHMDGSVIEFYGGRKTDFGFTLSDYMLDEIEVNYEYETRGLKMSEL